MKYRPEFPIASAASKTAAPSVSSFSTGITKASPLRDWLADSGHGSFRRNPNVLAHRQAVLDTAYQAHPDRFVRRPPKPLPLPTEVWINRPVPPGQKTKEESH